MKIYSHDTSSREGENKRKYWRYPPANPILPKILKGNPCQSFSKYISQLLYCINLTELDSTFYNFLTKPYGLISIMLSLGVELWWRGIFQDQSFSIAIVNRDIDFCLSYGKLYWFSKRFRHVYYGGESLQLWAKATISSSVVRRAIFLRSFDSHKTGNLKCDDVTSATLNIGGISRILMSINASKICIRITINLE